MKVQILCMACDKIVIKTVENWKKYSDRIVIYANGPDRNVIREKTSGVCVLVGQFMGYSETRNKLMEICSLEDYDINLFLDDSYEICGTISAGRLIKILDEKTGLSYRRNLIVKKGEKYVGKVHETVRTNEILTNNNSFYIIDRFNFLNELRRVKRMPSDLNSLDDSERDTVYKICILAKLSRFKEAKELCKSFPRKLSVERYIDFHYPLE